MNDSVICSKCGSTNRAGARFCIKCGADLVQSPGRQLSSVAQSPASPPAAARAASTTPAVAPAAAPADRPAAAPGRVFCPDCGRPAAADAHFCRNCGRPLGESQAASSPAKTVPWSPADTPEEGEAKPATPAAAQIARTAASRPLLPWGLLALFLVGGLLIGLMSGYLLTPAIDALFAEEEAPVEGVPVLAPATEQPAPADASPVPELPTGGDDSAAQPATAPVTSSVPSTAPVAAPVTGANPVTIVAPGAATVVVTATVPVTGGTAVTP